MAIKRQKVVYNTKNKIIKTAGRLFSKYTYLGVSMNDIARSLNITKAALYYHFSSKSELYKTVLNNAIDALSKSLAEASKEKTAYKKLYKLIKNYLDFSLKEKNIINTFILKLSPAESQVKQYVEHAKNQIINLIHPVVEEVLEDSSQKNRINSETSTLMLISTMNGLILEHLTLGKKLDTEQLSKQIISVYFERIT